MPEYTVFNEQGEQLYIRITQGMALGYYIMNNNGDILAIGRDYYDMDEAKASAERRARTADPADIYLPRPS